MRAKQKALHPTEQSIPKGETGEKEGMDITPQEKDGAKEEEKEGKSEDQQCNRTKEAEEVEENSKVKREVASEEYEKPEEQELVMYEGPWTKEEQYHYDIMFDELEWKNERKEKPDTAGLVAEMLGADSFEMELDE